MSDHLNTDPDNRLQENNEYSGFLAMLAGKLEIYRRKIESLNEHSAHVSDVLRAMEEEEKLNTNHRRGQG